MKDWEGVKRGALNRWDGGMRLAVLASGSEFLIVVVIQAHWLTMVHVGANIFE